MARRSYAGGAAALVLNGSITGTSLSISTTGTATGWPDGSGGKFLVVIDRGLASEEKLLVNSRSGNTLTVAATGDRGKDGTAAVSHSANAVVEHVIGAIDLDEPNAHVNLTTQDDHTQYMKADGTRHDLVARHAIAVLPTGTSGTTVALGNHTHATLSVLASFSQAGTLVTLTGKSRFRFPVAATIVDVTMAINTAPTGAALICDVNKNGTTIFTTQGNRPTIAAGANATASAAVPDVTAFAAGDYMTVDIDQVGSTIAGADLTVQVRYTTP